MKLQMMKQFITDQREGCSQSYRLKPVSNSKFARSRYPGRRRSIKAFQLVGRPGSVEAIFGLFHRSEEPIVVWIGDKDCLLYDYKIKRPKDCLFELVWNVFQHGSYFASLFIGCTTLEGAVSCVGNLFESDLGNLSGSRLSWSFPTEPEQKPFPFSCEVLKNYILQNQNGSCEFNTMIFTPSQCRTLATSGTKTRLVFDDCRFQDKGAAFIDSYLFSKHQKSSGPTRLVFHDFIALGESELLALLDTRQELSLVGLEKNLSLELCRAVVSAKLNYLELSCLKLTDEATRILINNILEGLGPKGISLQPSIFGSRERFLIFCDALTCLKEHQYLRTLEFTHFENDYCHPDLDAEAALLAAWRGGNLGLTSFALTRSCVTEFFWNSLLNHIRFQPTIRTLDFSQVRIKNSTATRQGRTEQLSIVIAENEHIQEVKFCNRMFDEEVWQKRVVPVLQHNASREFRRSWEDPGAIGHIHFIRSSFEAAELGY